MKAYKVRIKGESWQVVSIAENSREAKNWGYKAICDLCPEPVRYTDIRVKLAIKELPESLQEQMVFTSCDLNPFLCDLWSYDEYCRECGYYENRKDKGGE